MRLLHVVVALCVVLGIAMWAVVFGKIGPYVGFSMASYSIASTSMHPTLIQGELIFAHRGFYRDHEPEMGDLVIHQRPDDVVFVQRVVAGPGDRVRMRDGRLYINDQLAERTQLADFMPSKDGPVVPRYLETLPNGRSYEIIEVQGDLGRFDTTAEITIGDGQYFMLGDNRDNSNDSRVSIGPIALDQIIDRPSIVWFSTDIERIGKALQPAD